MRVDLFDFELPESAIALRPVEPRHDARLLVVEPGEAMHDDTVWELERYLKPGDALVLNDTKVIPARLDGTRIRQTEGGEAVSQMSATLHMRMGPDCWKAFARPAKRLRAGDRFRFVSRDEAELQAAIEGTITRKGEAGEVELKFDLGGAALDAAIHATGHIPLPPYIASKRPDDARDREDYQTIYAREEGAVAAPTAGLHFTEALFDKLDAAGIERNFVTLHVGAGTFLPVKADDTDDHVMHAEIGEVPASVAHALNTVKARGGRIVSIGTTSLRLLESAADESGKLRPWTGPTDIFITPGYRFRFVDLLMTNFHLPRSTLFMLVSAFCGIEVMQEAYRHAIEKGYRFYSYGDSSLLKRADLP